MANGNNADSDDDIADDVSPVLAAPRPSFFTVYKKGQGYYTRLGTALGVGLLIVVFAIFVYEQSLVVLGDRFYTPQSVPAAASAEQITRINTENSAGITRSLRTARMIAVGLTAALSLAAAAYAWRLMNRPKSADFLISTDSEMKKVNWPSREELFGSTRIVILFLFVIALLLFVIDIGTGAFFQLIRLLKFGPLGESS